MNVKKQAKFLKGKVLILQLLMLDLLNHLDEKLIMEISTNHELVFTIEEGSVGGFGSHVMQLLSNRGSF